jgi:5,10-methylenetetrahydromethanopterin reductase
MLVSVFAGAGVASAPEAIEAARGAAADGFGAIWFPQTQSVDALTALAAVAVLVPAIALGTAVVPIQGRHPLPLAQSALTVAQLAGPGRFTLGVGVTHPAVSERYGVAYRGVVDLFAQHLAALAPLLADTRRADVDGDRITARAEIHLDVAPPGLVVAALGPRMLELAGRHADGTVTWMTGPATLRRQVVPALAAAAERAGRPSPRVIVGLPVCVTDDVEGARQRIGRIMSVPASLPSYQRMLAAEGVAEPVEIALIGHEGQVATALAALAEAGATELLANVLGEPDEVARTRAFLGSLSSGS